MSPIMGTIIRWVYLYREACVQTLHSSISACVILVLRLLKCDEMGIFLVISVRFQVGNPDEFFMKKINKGMFIGGCGIF